MTSDNEVAWAAGFFDGEGSISINGRKARRGKKYYCLQLSLSNTHRPSVIKFAGIVGGGSVSCLRVNDLTRKMCWVWTAAALQAEGVLRLLLPFLVTKKKQANIALESRAYIMPLGNRRHHSIDYSVKLEGFRQRIIQVNHIGR